MPVRPCRRAQIVLGHSAMYATSHHCPVWNARTNRTRSRLPGRKSGKTLRPRQASRRVALLPRHFEAQCRLARLLRRDRSRARINVPIVKMSTRVWRNRRDGQSQFGYRHGLLGLSHVTVNNGHQRRNRTGHYCETRAADGTTCPPATRRSVCRTFQVGHEWVFDRVIRSTDPALRNRRLRVDLRPMPVLADH